MSTVLVVDDDPSTRSLFRLIFETAGHAVVEAAHGRAALDIVGPSTFPDVVVTDLRMPVLGGIELIEQLHSEPTTAAIPIIVVSADSDTALTLKAAGLVEAVIRKPFDVYALVECVGNVSSAHPVGAAITIGRRSRGHERFGSLDRRKCSRSAADPAHEDIGIA